MKKYQQITCLYLRKIGFKKKDTNLVLLLKIYYVKCYQNYVDNIGLAITFTVKDK